jgi:hypothetical protein
MLRGVLAASVALFCCAPVAAQSSGIEIGLNPATYDYTIPDDGQTYKWTFVMEEPGATFWLSPPNELETFEYRRTATGYEPGPYLPDAPYKFEQTVAPNLTTIFVRVPKGKPFSCNRPGPIGEICASSYRVWGNATQVITTGLPSDAESFRVRIYSEAVPEPATWGLMLVGIAGVGTAIRRRRTLAAA